MGTPLNVQIAATKGDGKPNPTFVGIVHFVSSDPQALLPPDYTMGAKDYGHAVISGLVLQSPGLQTVSAVDAASGAVLSMQTFTMVAAGSKLSLQLDVPTVVQAGIAFDCQITALDAVGQLQADYQGTLTLSTTDANVAASAPLMLDANSRGRATFRGIRLQALGQVSLTVIDTIGTVAGVAVQVVAGPAARLVVSNSGSAIAGVADNATVQVLDSFGHSAAYTGVLRFTSDDAQAVLPADFSLSAADVAGKSFTGGVIWKSAGTHVLGLRFVGVATDGMVPPQIIPATTMVAAGPAAILVLSPNMLTVASGQTVTLSASAHDVFGNLSSGFTGLVHVASSDTNATLPADFSIATGNANVPVLSLDGGAQNVTVFASGLSPGGAVLNVIATGGGGGPVVSAAPAQRLWLAVSPNATAGQALSVTATALDSNGSLAPSYTGTVVFSSTDPNAILPNVAAFVGGTVTLSAAVIFKTAGLQTLTLADSNGSIAASQQNIAVSAGPATMARLVHPASVTAGTPNTLAASAVDAFGNVAPTYLGTMHFSSTDGNAMLPMDAVFVVGDAGSKTLSGNVTLVHAGTMQLTATDVANANITGFVSVTVLPGSVVSLHVLGGLVSTAGLTLPVTVSPIDSLGNVVPTYRGTLHLSSTDTQARLPVDRLMGAVDAGLVMLNPILVTAGNQNLAIADVANSNIAGGITGIAVSAAPASRLALSMPSTSSAGVALGGVVLRAQDAFGNTAPSFVGVVNLSSGDANATLPTPVTFNSAHKAMSLWVAPLRSARWGRSFLTLPTMRICSPGCSKASLLALAPVRSVRLG